MKTHGRRADPSTISAGKGRRRATLLAAGLALALPGVAFAATTNVINGDPADYRIRSSGTTGGATEQNSILGQNSVGSYQNVVYVFELPAIGSTSMIESATLIARANLSYGLVSTSAPPFHVDLWGIGIQSSTTPIASYLHADTDPSPSPSRVKLQNDWFTEGSVATGVSVTNTSLNSGGTTNLAIYLQSFYATNAGYSGGSYVFLRLNPDQNPGGSGAQSGWGMSMADNSTSSYRPILSLVLIDAIPEPSVLGALALAATTLTLLRFRKNRGQNA